MRAACALGSLLALAGCGVYSVRLDPPPEWPATRTERPLDLTVSLGEVRSEANGRVEPLDAETLAAIDADFVRAARGSGLFRDALPRGASTDLYVETLRALHAAPMTFGRTAHLMLAGPLAILLPGFPHPWDYRLTRTVRLRGDVRGTSIPLPQHELTYDERIWGANYWGGLRADPLREAEGEYLAAEVEKIVASSYPLFRRFEAAARAGDVEDAWLASVQAGQAASSP
jgi:hypothetical protein